MGLFSGAPAAASLHGTASPALHQRIMTKNFDYDLLLTASVWEAKKDYDKEKNQGKLPRCHEDLLSLVIGWPLWTMVHYFSFGFLLLFSQLSLHQPYHTTSLTHSVHNQNLSLFFLWLNFFFFLAGLKCRWHKTHRVLKRLAFARRVPNTAQDGLGFLCSITWLLF